VSLEARTRGLKRGIFSEAREAVRLVTECNLSILEASKQTGVPKHKIYYAIRVQMKSTSLAKPREAEVRRWNEIAEMRDTGISLAEVAAFYGVSRQRIHQILKKRAAYLAWSAKQEA
jgi:DNA-directed RNA polymerase sigma subunit (sigma70/sigma32)